MKPAEVSTEAHAYAHCRLGFVSEVVPVTAKSAQACVSAAVGARFQN